MDYSRKISERQWNLPEKGELESRREATYIDDIIQKDHIQRKLLENLDGIRTVFDGGAGCGRFSILLAKQGCRVTHFDISQPMIGFLPAGLNVSYISTAPPRKPWSVIAQVSMLFLRERTLF